jgi:poly(hydroxyalkanoate) depolymerase family esterase
VVLYPSVTRSNDCWDVSTPAALTHSGSSDPAGLISMIQYIEQHNNGDASRVYVTGASSGGMATNVMLGDYPDVFKAGAAFMGVPFGCFATTDGSMWNSACAQGQITKTPQQWGDLVRAADPGYTGARPRMQLWHGTADTTLYYANFGEEIKQWTNVLGVPQTPTTTDSPQPNWTHTTYATGAGQTQVDAYSIAGVGHALPQSGMAAYAIHFFGLDSANPPPTSPSSTPSTPPSSPSTPPPGTACKVADTVNAWNTGLTDSITITNTGTTTINGWHLAFTLPAGQTITSAWNATITPSSGAVTATNMTYNATLAAGGTATFGFQADHTGAATAPTGFALDGTACTIG